MPRFRRLDFCRSLFTGDSECMPAPEFQVACKQAPTARQVINAPRFFLPDNKKPARDFSRRGLKIG